MKQIRTLFVGLALACPFLSVLAQPANDNLANRIALPGLSASVNGTTVGGTREPNEAIAQVGNNGHGRTVWYEWTPSISGTAQAYAAGGATRSILAVWTGNAHPLTQIVANRAGGFGANAFVTWPVTAGVSYKVMVDSSTQFQTGGSEFNLYVTMQPPTVNITSPANNQSFTNVNSITVSATASSPNGPITNVTFYTVNGGLIGSDDTAPFSVQWNNPPLGTTNIVAVATDSVGLQAGSPTITVNIRPNGYFAQTLLPAGSTWKYLDNGTDQGTAWQALAFDDSSWASGPAQLGYGDGDEATIVGFGGNANAKYITTYFRRAIVVSNAAVLNRMRLNLVRDDGAVVYINGTEVRRDYLPAGTITYTTPGTTAVGGAEESAFVGSSHPSLFVNGTNIVAVEIHQESGTSSDISFDLEIIAEGADGNSAPEVAITNPSNGAIFSPGANITITANATDADGSVTNVAFYADATKLGDVSTSPFSFTWNNVPQGNYTLTAVATDNSGANKVSAGVDITVNTFTVTPVTLIAQGATWKYLDNGSDQGNAWTALGFNDAAWASGPAQLGYGDGDEATVLSFGGDPANKHITYYFRRVFNVTNAAAVSNLTLRLQRDDGAVVYINGSEIRRDNMPAGAVDFTTRALGPVDAGSETIFFATTNTAPLVTGDNILAVSIHQANPTSSDISFDFELIANTIHGAQVTNTVAPFVQSQNPAAGSTVSSLNAVQVIFSEAVVGVNASDLLVNGTAAAGMSGSGNTYTFTFPQPPYGTVNITWAAGHGIMDQGSPQLAFDASAPGATWSYTLADTVAPAILSRTPPAGATLTNLNQVTVEFTEPVTGVNASDLLVNGSPAIGLSSGSATTYTFSFGQPPPGTVSITWASGHGITDVSPSANAFNATGAGATWNYNLTVPSTVLVASNGVWRFLKGTAEASNPIQAWRQLGFDHSSWSNAAAPFFYGDPYTNFPAGIFGTHLTDMQGSYQCIYLRQEFVIPSPAAVSNFIYRHQSDDGFVAWINGVEVLRFNMGGAPVDPPFQSGGVQNAQESFQGGAQYFFVTNTAALSSLVPGTNVIAIQAFNQSLTQSSDFGFNLQFEATMVEVDPTNLPPRITAVSPAAGEVFHLTNITITFSENVQNVNAGDLLVNGVAATNLTGSGSNYTFRFTQPAYGPVNITWASGHGIEDFDAPPKPFDGTAPGATFNYTLINPSAPTISSQAPVAGSTVTNLTQVQVTFSENVQGVDASDLLVNGTAANSISGGGASYTFTFTQPAYGNVAISWAAGHNIRDTEPAQNAFDPSRPGGTWQYTLIDRDLPRVVSQTPTAGANVTNLTQLTMTFSENVQGVNAQDLLINGVAATGVSGGGATYTFTFAQPNTSIVNIGWAGNHGIADLASPANAFNPGAAGNTWQYFTPDNVPPIVAGITPPPGATVRELSQVVVTFSEPVTGVSAGDLLINSVPAGTVSGSAAGPYTFGFTQPATGAVEIVWATGHGITDLAAPGNAFAGGEWNYVLNPNAVFTDKIVINEIMFHPSTQRTNEEWIEFHNVDTVPVNVAGWQLTRGVSFTFPNVSIPAGGFLAVAADVDSFLTKYPGVTNVIGNWAGLLSNTDEEIELETATGERVDLVHYADNGDWAIRQRGPLDSNSRGWEWFSLADGLAVNTTTGQTEGGRTLELRNPLMPNQHGQNWGFSGPTNGTPGAANSARTNNIPPLVLDVAHFPAIPKSSDPVTITTKIKDEQTNGLVVTLYHRNHSTTSPGAFTATPMFDDGAHNDGLANDGVYGVVLAAQPNRTVIEYYVQAMDAQSNTRTWPAAARQLDGSFAQTANALYQVDDEVYAGNQPIYRIVITESERVEMNNMNTQSDAEVNCTFISVDGEGTKVRHTCGIRNRGAGSRGAVPRNRRVNIPTDDRWNGLAEINLNTQFTWIQTLGSAVSLKSGLPAAEARAVQVRINGENLASSAGRQFGSYVLVEPLNGDWAENHYPNDGNGNVYRASTGNHNADLSYQGTNPNNYLARGYSKTSNQSENDWRDMFNLTFALSQVAADADYVQAIRTNINILNWARYFAVSVLMEYSETSLATGRGDDYAMYRPVVDPRFTLIPHDFDTIFGQGDTGGNINESIWVMLNPPNTGANVPVLNRFLRHPEVAPVYLGELKRLAESSFASSNLNAMVDQFLGDWVPTATRDAIKNFNSARTAAVLSQLPLRYSVAHNLTMQNGYLRATTATIALTGTANAIDTRTVRVNGAASTYSGWEGRWTNNAVALQPGVNNLLVEAVGTNNVVVWSTNLVVWFDTGTFNDVSGTISGNTVWSPGAGPFRVTGSITVASGATLTIQPGATVFLNQGVGITVASGGRILAEGTPTARIRIAGTPGAAGRWNGIVINGAAGTPQSRLAYAHVEGNNNTAIDANGSDVVYDNLTFGTTDRRYLDLDGASFLVSNCHFPDTTAAIEPVHGGGGIRSGGRAIFLRNYFGRTSGYNDVVDFTGGNRPGPILEFINNVFMGSDDDLLDLDGTDAWVEGNIFLHAHRNGSPDTASGVSGGSDAGQTSEITVIGNIFFDVDQAAMAKQGNFYTFINNTVVNQTSAGFQDAGLGAVLAFADDTYTLAAGMYVEGNVVVNAERLTRFLTNGTAVANNTTFNNNLMPFTWSGNGTNNSTADPMLTYVPQVSETFFTSWQAAQVMKSWFAPKSGSPAIATGPNGRDKGGVIPLGASISGEPAGTNSLNSATLRVGPVRSGNSIPASGFPNGSGYTHYRWRLDEGPWSAETPATTPISLSNLLPGAHRVDVAGRRDAGFYQDNAAYGADAGITASRTWFVNTAGTAVRLNEVLASNSGALVHSNTTPDAIELHNLTGAPVNIGGWRLTDDPADPDKFVFPANTSVPPNGYLVVFADSANTPGIHLGFALSADGEGLYLYDSVDNGGALLDAVEFGLQLADLSIGRTADGSWDLTTPTFGAANVRAGTGDPRLLRINEWLAIGYALVASDFIEVYNPQALPVSLGGLYLTDEPINWPNQHQIAALSFIAPYGYRAFTADGDAEDGADHLNFTISPEQGVLGLMNRDLSMIDCVVYGPQWVDVSQGRSPNGSLNIISFATPTPGSPNAAVINTNSGVVINEVFANNETTAEPDGTTPDWIELYNLSASPVNIGDLSVSDSTLTPRRYVFAAGTMIPANGYLRLRCDPDLPASATNSGFGLKANGGAVYLYDALANGGGLLNSVIYGLQTADFSVGRVPNGTGGFVLTLPTAEGDNIAASLASATALRINEWMAAPSSGDDWFEIYNPNQQPVAIGGYYTTDNLANRTKSPIPPLSFIGGGSNGWVRIWADNNPAAGANHAAFALGANGEALGLSTPAGVLIDSLTFPAQQTGVSEGRFPDGSSTIARFFGTASPNEANYLAISNIVINEVLTHTDLPLEDAIELRNLTASPVNIGHWWLSDAKSNLRKFRIPAGTTIPANGYVVFYEDQFNSDTNDPASFSFSSGEGDQVYLSTGDASGNLTGFRTSVNFGAAENGVSFGRYVSSEGRVHFPAMSARSFGQDDPGTVAQFRTGTGAANPYPKVGPVVISQIMYRPPDVGTNDNTLDEFIELQNITGLTVPLYHPTATTNTWRLRDAVDFNFPQGVVLAAGARLLVVSFDPAANPGQLAAFRTKYSIDATLPIYGPYSGKLANGDENVELYKPDAPNAGQVPYVLVEQVHYYDAWPWPAAADGTGAALKRVSLTGFGNDPTNWVAQVPNFGGGADTDNDGMPDAWENQYGLNPNNAADANLDLDGDGMTNLQEYLAGTNPASATSALRITSIENLGGNTARLTFLAVSNRTYTVEFKTGLEAVAWTKLIDIGAAPSNRVMQINTPVPTATRFYRVRTPQAP